LSGLSELDISDIIEESTPKFKKTNLKLRSSNSIIPSKKLKNVFK